MPQLGANFDFESKQPNFKRDQFETLEAMAAYTICDDGHVTYCKEDGERYEFKESNSVDPTTGKWRLYKPGGEADNLIGDDYDTEKYVRVYRDKGSIAEGMIGDATIICSEYATIPPGSTMSVAFKAYENVKYMGEYVKGCAVVGGEGKIYSSATCTLQLNLRNDTSNYVAFEPDMEFSLPAISLADGENSHAEGLSIAKGECSHSEGYLNNAKGDASHAEGECVRTLGEASHAEGISTLGEGIASHAEGEYTKASGEGSHAEGSGSQSSNNIASGRGSHAEGINTNATGDGAHAEGVGTNNVDNVASGMGSHAEGKGTQASGGGAHAEGGATLANGDYSHAEGNEGIASGKYSHTEGYGGYAYGKASHKEGFSCTAGNSFNEDGSTGAHAEGNNTTAQGANSHTEGFHTTAYNESEHAEGRYNESHYTGIDDKYKTIHSVGVGTSLRPKNAHEIMRDGTHYLGTGKVFLREYSASKTDDNDDIGSRLTALEAKPSGGGVTMYDTATKLAEFLQPNGDGGYTGEVEIHANDGNRIFDLRVLTLPCTLDIINVDSCPYDTTIIYKGTDDVSICISDSGTITWSKILYVNEQPEQEEDKSYIVSIQGGVIVFADTFLFDSAETETTSDDEEVTE